MPIDPLKFLMTRPTLTGRLAKWAVLLLQFDITYVPQKAIKGQALADFLAAHPLPADSPLNDDLPDEQIHDLTSSQIDRSQARYVGKGKGRLEEVEEEDESDDTESD